MRWAVFKDFRGVAYCEPVDPGLKVFTKHIPARPEKRDWRGRIKQHGHKAGAHHHVKFDEEYYDRGNFVASAFEDAQPGFEYNPNRIYLLENRWGPVDVLLFIDNDILGRRMQYEFRRLAPERELYDLGKGRDNKAAPNPITDHVIEQLKRIVG